MIEQTKKKYPGQCLRKLSVLMVNKQKLVNKDFKCQFFFPFEFELELLICIFSY